MVLRAVRARMSRYASTAMKRRFVFAIWIAGATVPLLLATVFLFGCCVLPFHRVMHKLMPICELAANVMRGDSASDAHDHSAVPPTPVREKQDPVKRITAIVSPASSPMAITASKQLIPPCPTKAFRSFISLGAVRCDHDVGLNTLLNTLLI